MIGKEEGFGNDDILSSSGSEDHDLGHIVGSQRFTAGIDCICFGFIPPETYNGKLLYEKSASSSRWPLDVSLCVM